MALKTGTDVCERRESGVKVPMHGLVAGSLEASYAGWRLRNTKSLLEVDP